MQTLGVIVCDKSEIDDRKIYPEAIHLVRADGSVFTIFDIERDSIVCDTDF